MSDPQAPSTGRFRALVVLLAGAALSVAGFLLAGDAYRRQVEAQFHTAAQDRAESVAQGFQHSFEDVLVLRDHFEAGCPVDRASFEAFAEPLRARRPYIQALQWLPEVGPDNRAALETAARRAVPGFRFFDRDAAGRDVPVPPDARFHAVYFVNPYRGNEVSLGYAAERLPSRQEALARALSTGELSASGRIRLIQETGEQTGILALAPVRDPAGRTVGLVQGVFRTGDLVQRALSILEPRGVDLQLLDASAPPSQALLYAAASALPSRGGAGPSRLRLARDFELGGRRWSVVAVPSPGYYRLTAGWRAWGVLAGGLAFSLVLASYVRTLLASQAQVQAQVEARTQELERETESHRRDARALRESDARFRHLVEVMGDGMWVLDSHGMTTFANRRMAEMLGYRPAEMIGRTLADFMFPEDAASASQRDLTQRREGIGAQHDFRFRRKDGSELWSIVTGNPVLDDDGRVVSVLGMVTDITERRRAEQAQLQSQKLESLGVLAGGIAHDFNNLLTAILGNVSLAQMTLPAAAPAQQYLSNLEKTVHRATGLTRQMLAYSGKGRFEVGPLDLNEAVTEMSHLLGVSISKKVSLRFQLQEGLPAFMAEPSQIQQVVMNLVTNASEAIGDAEGVVSIRTELFIYSGEDLIRDFPGQNVAPGAFLALEVSDTGHGMSPEVQARIFEPFFTTKFTGRGLGLSAMQGIVRGHKGGIRVYSEIGKGTTFKLIFPAGTRALPHLPEEAEPEAWRGSGTVLVVDDEEGVRTVAEALLHSMGFDVVTARDGQEALTLFRSAAPPFCAVLMDLTMPHMNGVETYRELRRIDPACRVVLTSGYNEQEAVQSFLGKGLVAFVQKPFQRTDLIQAMRKALGV
ncbi:CHASE domain-containing protein [Geothrix sp. 21YS21S-4]|uniref:CHASE domain-containing protein n=1 Tax=Geothrix sp. 21YS21S-4 TaxID=3068889 RepID=UPI0027BA6A85|nr:CHASE domain-containing protein [Geothrix sp. 21YS21S-4]